MTKRSPEKTTDQSRRQKIKRNLPNLFGKIVLAVVASLILASFSAPAMANENYTSNAGDKLFRGVVNGVSGWLEFSKQIFVISREGDPFTGFTCGAAKGVTDSVHRTAAGVYETGTFFVPLPTDYESVIDPEYVWNDVD